MRNVFEYPIYRISPYTTYRNEDTSDYIEDFSSAIAPQTPHVRFLESGRMALSLVLDNLDLRATDEIAIVTSSGNSYISSCVTNTISKYCKYSRSITQQTKCIILIHEFGKFCNFDFDLVPEGCVVIDDFAHAPWVLLTSELIKGDFAIFSLSKFLNIRNGGMLLSKNEVRGKADLESLLAKREFYKSRPKLSSIFDKKKQIYKLYLDFLKKDNVRSYFYYEDYECPGVFLFKIELAEEKLHRVKMKMQELFIECSVFYGENAFFLPINSNMNVQDVEYICNRFKYFIGELR